MASGHTAKTASQIVGTLSRFMLFETEIGKFFRDNAEASCDQKRAAPGVRIQTGAVLQHAFSHPSFLEFISDAGGGDDKPILVVVAEDACDRGKSEVLSEGYHESAEGIWPLHLGPLKQRRQYFFVTKIDPGKDHCSDMKLHSTGAYGDAHVPRVGQTIEFSTGAGSVTRKAMIAYRVGDGANIAALFATQPMKCAIQSAPWTPQPNVLGQAYDQETGTILFVRNIQKTQEFFKHFDWSSTAQRLNLDQLVSSSARPVYRNEGFDTTAWCVDHVAGFACGANECSMLVGYCMSGTAKIAHASSQNTGARN